MFEQVWWSTVNECLELETSKSNTRQVNMSQAYYSLHEYCIL